ncbi:GNAT family N-acetyltransferase [Rhizohabitans arisaemae]|uniref:GNAT family N-acetyltransferase n=1 Tax=Rhizohabitans arisaemae TaxID=2720610 RepID=UPI0024B0941F|nr:GNAT family N-acetyltransferase [Rhizohabitans arisaemae]
MNDIAVRVLHTSAEFEEACLFFGGIWSADPGGGPFPADLMRAMAHAGNYVAGAFRGGRMVGASAGFFGAPVGEVLHSHITGTLAGQGIGFALKSHQREWALARGLSRITWTYDPLIRRNAYFNTVKLGALPEEYLPSFYGVMTDSINAGDESDRMLMVWRLSEPHVAAAVRGERWAVQAPPDAVYGLTEEAGLPVLGRTDASTVLVSLPADVEGLRRTDPGAARAWRYALREVMTGLLDQGAKVIGFHDKSAYIVQRTA